MKLRNKQEKASGRKRSIWLVSVVVIITLVVLRAGKWVMQYTSTDQYCMSCHIHPSSDSRWKLSTHYKTSSGVLTHCAECHLPPKGKPDHLIKKAKHGAKDIYGYLFKDSSEINWEAKNLAENAKGFVYEESCLKCHQNLFPVTLSVEGSNAHLFYTTSTDPMRCITCHLNVGHYDPNAIHAHDSTFGVSVTAAREVFTQPAAVEKFSNFAEQIPGTSVTFNMIAIPGGSFNMGSPESEPLREEDEGPVRKVQVSPFWMAEAEVTWDAYLAFFRATGSPGRTEGQVIKTRNVDAISGPTPPWGAPDQGWGKGDRPAITMTWHAANVYCQWLSKRTVRLYRLPTEAEWEYACRGGTETPYFFEGNPKKLSSEGFLKKLLGTDTSVIASHVVYKENSNSRTLEPSSVDANPFGLRNMSGNIAEFCLDFYSPDNYKTDSINTDPRGPAKGAEHVVRGGSFRSDAKDVRSAARDFTRTKAWLVTDPQIPKSIWWYSDVIDVGFRVVCIPDSSLLNEK